MKNLLLLATTFCTVFTVQAQLYVQPNGTTDTYVYVKDEVLFVEQDVNLVANNPGSTESSIYLRSGSQLIQGSTIDPSGSSNSGTGTLSVFQESYGDSWDYTFWCSPVGLPSGGAGNTFAGIGRINDSISLTNSNLALTTTGYNGEISPLRISTYWFYRWNPITQRWQANGTGNTIPTGYGFTMKGVGTSNHSQRYDFRGRPNNGDIVLPIQTSAIPFTDGNIYYFTFAGNPYPSALDLAKVIWDSDNVEVDSFRYWEEDLTVDSHLYIDNKGGYGTWIPGVPVNDPAVYTTGGQYTVPTFMNYDSAGNPTTSTGVFGTDTERLFAPIGQGFMISANSGDSPDDGFVTIKNSHRAYVKEGASNFSEFRAPTIPESKLRIHAIFGQYSHFRDMLLLFHNQATDGYDRGMDATHPMDGAKSEAYFTIGDSNEDNRKNLVIEAIDFDINKMIPIAFKLSHQEKITLKVAEEINKPYAKAFLYDKQTGVYRELMENASSVSAASITLPAGTYEGRFFITFDDGVINDEDKIGPNSTTLREPIKIDFAQNNPARQLEILNDEMYDIKELNIFDMSGKLVYFSYNVGSNDYYSFPTAMFSDGVYLVKLTTSDHGTITHKINVTNK